MRFRVIRALWLRRVSAVPPVTTDLTPERSECLAVVWHGEVGEVSSHDAGEPAPCSGMGRCIRRVQLGLDRARAWLASASCS